MTSAMVHAGILSVLVCTCVLSTHEYLFFLLVDFHDFLLLLVEVLVMCALHMH